jgi:SAM-dependent methyltransferase
LPEKHEAAGRSDGAETAAIFDRMAGRYDELRQDDEGWWELFDATVARGLGAATRLLDIGCGTGRFAAAAAERLGIRTWGLDPSGEMLARARARGVRGAGWKQGVADDLPFRDGWFDAAVMRLVVHTLGARRPAALREAARVLAPGGSLYVWTFEPEHFTGFYLAPYLPSLPALDLARFPDPDALAAELVADGFAAARTERLVQHRLVGRASAAERIRAGYISTVHLLPPGEVEAAARRLEDEAAAGAPALEATQRWRLVVGRR